MPTGEIEAAVIDQLRAVFRQPEIVAGTWKAARSHADDISKADEVVDAGHLMTVERSSEIDEIILGFLERGRQNE